MRFLYQNFCQYQLNTKLSEILAMSLWNRCDQAPYMYVSKNACRGGQGGGATDTVSPIALSQGD